MSAARARFLAIAASAAFVSLAYLTPPSIFESEDYVKLHSLNREYLVQALWAGHLPLWNPYVGLGRPFLADIETAAFYPPNLLYCVLEPHLCLALLLTAHVALCLLSSAALARHLGLLPIAGWLIGIGFVGSGVVFAILHSGQVPYGQAALWLPLLFLLAARLQDGFGARRLAALALALALQLLCGHPQMAWLSWFGLAVFLFGRGWGDGVTTSLRRVGIGLGALALALAWGLAVAAVQLLPFLELAANGNRSHPTLASAIVGSIPWEQWGSLFLPALPDTRLPLGTDSYLGPLLTLAGLAGLARFDDRNLRGLALLAIVAGLLTLGERTPLFGLGYAVVPGFAAFRFPGRFAVLVVLALLVGAGWFLSRAPGRTARVILPLAVLLLLIGTFWWHATLPGPLRTTPLLVSVLALAGASAAILLSWHPRSGPERLFPSWSLPTLLLIVVVGDLAIASMRHLPFRGGLPSFPAEKAVAETLRGAGLLTPDAPPPRISVPFPLIRDNSGMRYGFGNFSGYVALTLGTVWSYLHESLGLTPSLEANTFPSPDIFGFGPFPYHTMNIVLGFVPATGRLVLNPDPDPRAYLVHAVEVVADTEAAIARLRALDDAHRTAILTADPGASLHPLPPGSAERATIVRFGPSHVEIGTHASNAALLVVAEAWYPGWHAFVNGREVSCLRANAWMRAVVVPPGPAEVVLVFRSTYLALGAWISSASVLLAVAALARPLRSARATERA